MFVGACCAAAAGVVMPIFSIIFGDILDAFHGADPAKEVGNSVDDPHQNQSAVQERCVAEAR